MRRKFIFLHRSVRSVRVSKRRLAAATVMAIVLSAAVAIFGTYLLNAHGRLCALFLKLSAIPVAGLNTLDIFSAIGPAKSPLTEASDWTANTDRTGILFIVSMLVLLALHRRFALARNFLVFLMVLVLVSAGIMVFDSLVSL